MHALTAQGFTVKADRLNTKREPEGFAYYVSEAGYHCVDKANAASFVSDEDAEEFILWFLHSLSWAYDYRCQIFSPSGEGLSSYQIRKH